MVDDNHWKAYFFLRIRLARRGVDGTILKARYFDLVANRFTIAAAVDGERMSWKRHSVKIMQSIKYGSHSWSMKEG